MTGEYFAGKQAADPKNRKIRQNLPEKMDKIHLHNRAKWIIILLELALLRFEC